MSKNNSKFSNENKQRMLFWPKLAQKMDFGVGILKTYLRIRNRLFQDTICANFQAKRTILDFFSPNLPKNEFWGHKLQKSKSGFNTAN